MAIRGYDIGGMLARAGQAQGQQIASGFQQFGQGLGGLFSGVTRGLQKRQERKEREETAQEVQQLLQQYANNPAQLNAMGQKYASEGNNEMAELFFDAAKAATGKVTGRGKGELMALANNPKFNVFDQKQQSGYLRMADIYGVSREDAMNLAIEAVEAREGRDTDKKAPTYASVGDMFKDDNNNVFVVTERRTGTGVELITQPVGHSEKQSGKLTPAGGAYGETAGEKTGRDVEAERRETEAREFATLRIKAIDNLPKIESTIVDAEKALGLLKNLQTGGFTTNFVRAAQRFLGVEPKDQAQFNLKAGEVVLKSLDNFPGAISNAEREYLERLYFSLEKSGGANQGILEELLEAAQFALKDAKVRASSDTFQDYLDNRPSRVASVAQEESEPTKVDFGSLK